MARAPVLPGFDAWTFRCSGVEAKAVKERPTPASERKLESNIFFFFFFFGWLGGLAI
jgi:hypothetical protein